MPAVGTIASGAGRAGGFGHARHGFAAAFGEEIGDLALGVLAAAVDAGEGQVGLRHGAEGFELVMAILTDVFVNGHEDLSVLERLICLFFYQKSSMFSMYHF